MGCTTSNSHTWREVSQISPSILKTMYGCFLGEWTVKAADIFQPALAKVCKVYPRELVFAKTNGDLTYFYEQKGDDVQIIAVLLKNALENHAMNYMNSLMKDLFAGHPVITRRSMATLDSHMTGFGPFWRRFELDGGSKVSFYTHVEKLGQVLKNLPTAKEFEALADRYAHTHLAELILALYLWKLPGLVQSFFKFSKPFLGKEDYEMTPLELALGGYGPCAYQLYIIKDFCSSIHKDVDTSEFTLTYCSHPDAASTTRVQFVMAQHGFIIEPDNGSLFAFKADVAHGTGYRNHTHNAAYMGCLVVNSALHALTKRRQRL